MKLLIPRDIYSKMLCYATAALPNEVTGIGILETVPNTTGCVQAFRVSEVRIAPQRTSNGYCEFEDEALHGVLLDLIEEGRTEDLEKLRLRWHSHGAGSVFFSTVDVKDIEENTLDAAWIVSLVINTKGEFTARLDLYQPFRISESLTVEIVDELPVELMASCRVEVTKHLRPIAGPAPVFADKVPATHSQGKSGAYARPYLKGGEENAGFFGPNQVL
ncbi:MAG: hypothetical protein Q4B29_00460 [Candidatus Saccharibacteria bacterium]|nr:hypothetical protein [Candidatus Saccharibacteria bacterium]